LDIFPAEYTILILRMTEEKGSPSSHIDFHTCSCQGIGLLLVSAATLCFEINLTRLFSVSQFYHYAFMVVSIALFGVGASGTFLALSKQQTKKIQERKIPWLAGLTAVCILGSYLLTNILPFDSYSIFINPSQIIILLLHYLTFALPFFFSGMIISIMLREYRSSGGSVYAVNLIGSAAGCLIALVMPALVDGGGVVVVSAAMASLAGFFFLINNRKENTKKTNHILSVGFLLVILIATSSLLGSRLLSGQNPDFFDLYISPYKSISYALQPPEAHITQSNWNSFSRVDIVSSSSLHSFPGLSYRYTDTLPTIDGLFVDGDNLNALLPEESDMTFADFLPASVAFDLRPGAEVMILEPMGGLDIQAAVALGANQVTAVEHNPLMIEAAASIYNQNKVYVVRASGRSYLHGDEQLYDVIQLPLTDSYHPVSSGAYTLGEDYRFTLEAFKAMIDRLKPDGILVVTRWLQKEPSEWLRVFTLTATALEEKGYDPHNQIIAFRGYNTGTILVGKNGFSEDEINIVRAFTSEKAFDLVFAPINEEININQFNVLQEPVYYQTFQEFIEQDSRTEFYKSYPYDVRPPTDDQPFFSHFFKWSQLGEVLQSLGTTWQPFGGAGYLVILVIFLLALLLSGLLILLPVVFIKRTGIKNRTTRIPIYFGMIGLAFLLVEMPLIQRFILFVDHPAYAVTAVLFCILLFSGLGSRFGSQKLSLSKALLFLIGLLSLYIFILPHLLHALLGLHLILRAVITILLIAPIGFLMGIPLPAGLEWMKAIHHNQTNASDRWMIAWVWAVNGASSVVASILSSLLALSFGLTITTAVGIIFYLAAWGLVIKK